MTAVRALLISLDFLLLSTPRVVQPWLGDSAFPAATILLVVVNVALVVSWVNLPRGRGRETRGIGLLAAIPAAVMIFFAARAWLHEILIYPHDSQRADMLIVIQRGIERLLQGQNPYTIYRVPWDAPLPYGPMLWAPFMLPRVVGADVRFATILGALFVVVLCAIGAIFAVRRGETVAALGAMILVAAITFSPDLRGFMSIGHTTVYWPLLALLAWLMCRPDASKAQRGEAAALTLGLLVVARTTMVALVPVLMMAIWHHARDRFGRALAILVTAIVLPFLPFAVWDWRTLWYGLYGSYQHVMKGFVWVSTDWVQHTIGVTGPLLSSGWGQAVEAVQVAAMIAVYAAAWLAIGRGRPALPWMGLALLVFSMTTLWPVYYIYFDVFVLLACGAVAQQMQWPGLSRRPYVSPGANAAFTALPIAVLVLVATTWVSVPAEPVIEVGTFVIAGTPRKILVPARTHRDAGIVITAQQPTPNAVHRLSATLNGTLLGTMAIAEEWRDITFPAPRSTWRIGINELDLTIAVSPSEAAANAVAVDRVRVRNR